MGKAERIRKKAIINAFENLKDFEEIEEWREDALEQLKRDPLTAIESKRSMFDTIGDEISTFVEDSDQVEEICESVRQALLSEIDESKKVEVEADENTVVSNSSQQFSVSMSRVRAVFGKEAKKRRDVMVIGDDALHCRHEFFGEPCGGLKCQVCDFETKNRVWKCGKQCSIGLCGSCAFKWKKNILHL